MKKTILLLAAIPAIGLLVAFSLRTHAPYPDSELKTLPADDPFKALLKQFKPATLPYTLSAKNLQAQMSNALTEKGSKNPKKVGRLQDPEGLIPFDRMEMMSRVPTYREPEAQFATAENYVVIYTVSRGFSRPYKSYVAVVFDKQGTALSSHRIAETSYDYLTAATIDVNLQATVQTYRINWKKEDPENPDADRAIAGLSPETSKIIDLTQPNEDDEKRKLKPMKKADLPATESLGAVEQY